MVARELQGTARRGERSGDPGVIAATLTTHANVTEQEPRPMTGLSLPLHPPLRRRDEAEIFGGYRGGHAVVEERDDAPGCVDVDASRMQDPVRFRAFAGQQTEQKVLGADHMVRLQPRSEGVDEPGASLRRRSTSARSVSGTWSRSSTLTAMPSPSRRMPMSRCSGSMLSCPRLRASSVARTTARRARGVNRSSMRRARAVNPSTIATSRGPAITRWLARPGFYSPAHLTARLRVSVQKPPIAALGRLRKSSLR